MSAFFILLCRGMDTSLVALDDFDLGFDDQNDDEIVAEMLGEEVPQDLNLLKISHLSFLSGWDGVQLRNPAPGETNAPVHWKNNAGIVSPLDAGSIATLIEVPEDGSYRLSLRHQLNPQTPSPVTLALIPQRVADAGVASETATGIVSYIDSGSALEHVFGTSRLMGGLSGKGLESKMPIRFERETQLISIPSAAVMVWEYWDVNLQKGVYRATLATPDKRVRAEALFFSRSKDFRPNFGTLQQDPSLGRIYVRFRVLNESSKTSGEYTVSANLSYHWGPRKIPGSDGDYWSWPIGKTSKTPQGEWTPFLEATDAILPGPGPWSSCNLGVSGASEGEIEVQFSWHPDGRGEVVTVKTGLGGGKAMVRVPHGVWMFAAETSVPGWGMWNAKPGKKILTQEAVIERYFTWAREAIARLKVREDHPLPRLIRLSTSNGTLPANRERATDMLATLGINWIYSASPDAVKRLGLHDEGVAFNTHDAAALANKMTDETRDKMIKVNLGDEISTYMSPTTINADPVMLEAFHDYLQEQAQLEGLDISTFLGVPDLGDIECIDSIPVNPGLFERRLFYHSHRFCHLAFSRACEPAARSFEHYFPNVRIYYNYTPHPTFLTGTTMNGADWFVMARNKAQTLGWAEDWATSGSWGLGSSYECVSFYAALVECSVRKHGYPSGFYVGSNCGASAKKIFGCLAQGVTWLELYTWGPIDGLAEGSNAWSEHESEYYSILSAACALGPADEIIAKGQREPRRTAILYNRSHEIMHGGKGRLNHDWMWTFFALKHARIPVEVIIEEDLNAEDLKRYDCVFVGGLNLAPYHLAALTRWVEEGGLLIGTGGAAMRDLYDDLMPQTVALFGAQQRSPGTDKAGSITCVKTPASEWFPAAEWKSPGDMAFVLEPTTAKPLASYGGGECAAAINALGKGHALLLGFRPGFVFRDNGRSFTGNVRDWVVAPVLKRLGRQRVEFDHAMAEGTLFEHESGLAVMLTDFGSGDAASTTNGSHLSVQTDRVIKEVSSALCGPLEWKREGNRIEITTPQLSPVDVIILK